MNTDPIAAARFKLAYERPYLAQIIWSLIPVKVEGIGTLAVDKYHRLYYDPRVADKWTIHEIVSVLYHEVLHLLRAHPERGENKDQLDFNISADAEINDDINDEGCWSLPDGHVTPKALGEENGKLAEEYYEALRKKKRKKKPGASPNPGAGNCGSAAHGHDQEWEQGPPSAQNPGVKPGQSELIKRQVAKDTQEHSKSRGSVPGHLERWANEKLKAKVNWRKTLATAIRHAVNHVSGAGDYTFTRMSRRQSGSVILPATWQPKPEVAVVIDTSGSMSEQDLNAAIAETGAILKSLGLRDGVHVLAVDAEVHAAKRVFSDKQVEKLLKGGGGTDMGVGIAQALKMNPRPKVIIVLTDGETPWPKAPPPAKVIVGIIPNRWSHGRKKGPEWAKTVYIEEGDE